MMLVDANVLMYAAGSPHPNKPRATAVLNRIPAGDLEAALDAEVLHEIMHRYRALNRWTDGEAVYRAARRLFSDVLPVTAEVMDRAFELHFAMWVIVPHEHLDALRGTIEADCRALSDHFLQTGCRQSLGHPIVDVLID